MKKAVSLILSLAFILTCFLIPAQAATDNLIAGLKCEISGKDTFDFSNAHPEKPKTSEFLTDGDNETIMIIWKKGNEGGTTCDTYFTYDLGKLSTVKGFMVIPNKEGFNITFQVSTDKKTWKDAYSIVYGTWKHDIVLDAPMQARYVRFYFPKCIIDAGDRYIQVKEWEVYGYTGTMEPASESSKSESVVSQQPVSSTAIESEAETSSAVVIESTTESEAVSSNSEFASMASEESEESGFPWIAIVIAAVVVVAGGAVAIIILLKKKGKI